MKFVRIVFLYLCQFSLAVQSQEVWTQKTDFPGCPRLNPVNFALNGSAYIGGGFTPFIGPVLSDFWQYDPMLDTWTPLSNLPFSFGVSLNINDTIYIITSFESSGIYTYEFWKYNLQQDMWTFIVSFTNLGTENVLGGFTLNQKGYIILDDLFPRLFEFEPLQNIFIEKTNLGITGFIDSFTTFAIQNSAFFFSGTTNQGFTNDLWEWNSLSNQWTQRTSLPALIRHNSSSISFDNNGFIMGGLHGNYPYTSLNDFWLYNSLSDTWTQLDDFGGLGRGYSICFILNNLAYFGLGANTACGFTDFWSYDLISEANSSFTNAISKVFPNPADDKIFFQFFEPHHNCNSIKIYNSIGILMFSDILTGTNLYSLNINSLPSGFYTYTIYYDNHLYNTGKFIKE